MDKPSLRALLFVALVGSTFLGAAACTDRGGASRTDAGGGVSDTGSSPEIDSAIVRTDSGPAPGTCVDAARWIYIVDQSSTLLSFQPDTRTLTVLGSVSCPAGGAMPFSMAVDRNARAWVLHTDRRIYQVDLTGGLGCTATSFVPGQLGYEAFGMGFVSDAASSTETLYIAGGAMASIGLGMARLGTIDTGTLTVADIGAVGGSPELTGTGAGELWGFFPDSTPPSVRQINRATAATIATYDVSAIDSLGFGGASAWAFAFWGGRYYIFYQGLLDTSTNIWSFTPSTGALVEVMHGIGRSIVGAGVSTCAPVELI